MPQSAALTKFANERTRPCCDIAESAYQTANSDTAYAINDGTTTCNAITGNSIAGTASAVTVSCTFNYTTSGDRTFTLYVASDTSTVNVILNDPLTPASGVRFLLEYFGSTSTYSSQCGANCVDTFSALVTDGAATTTVSQENAEFITGNCTLNKLLTLDLHDIDRTINR